MKYTLQGFSASGCRWITVEFNKKKDAEQFAQENCLRWFIGKTGKLPVMAKAVSK